MLITVGAYVIQAPNTLLLSSKIYECPYYLWYKAIPASLKCSEIN